MDDATRLTHESYACIRANRVSGDAPLFNSALKHMHYVNVTISRAEQVRRNGHMRVHALNDLLTVSMSEAQFAEFITSMNMGSGAACTLTRLNNKSVERPPADINTRKTFENEVQAKADEMQKDLEEALRDLDALLDRSKPATKGEMKIVRDRVAKAQREIAANMPHMMSIFAENMENIVQEAKMDINGHANMVQQGMIASGHSMKEIEGDGEES